MVQAIREIVTVEEGGVVRLRSSRLSPGERVELIVLVDERSQGEVPEQNTPSGGWRRFVGCIKSGDPHGADNDRIDEDLAREAAGES